MTTATQTIDINAMGIADMKAALASGLITAMQVLAVLQARIDKRIANKKPLLAPVVAYRNELALASNDALGTALAPIPVPVYAKAAPSTVLPTDPDQLADVVFATVGVANVGQVIARLTARIVGA